MSVRVDNSYIYKYLEEMHQREAAKTAAEQAESKKKEIPYIIARYAGVAAIILSIGIALYFSNSFKQISESISTSTGQAENTQSQFTREGDDLIDVDALLAEVDETPTFPKSKTQLLSNQPSVRNYVIFDRIEFQKEGLEKITIGRQYDDPESDVSSSWCYVDRINSNGFKNTLHLVSNFGDRDELEITNEIADSFGLTKELLIEAQELCTI
jgi:hypothetical protein